MKQFLQKFKENSTEYIAITLIFYGLFFVVVFACLFRFLGWGFYSKIVEPREYPYWLVLAGNFILKWFEGVAILCSLTKLRLWQGAIASFVWMVGIFFIVDMTVETVLDFVYIIVLPFAFIKPLSSKKEFLYAQVGKIAVFLSFLLAYQFAMSYGVYELTISENVKYDFVYMLKSVIPYKLFIVWLYLFFRRKDLCKKRPVK